MKLVGDERDQIAEGMRARRVAMEEDYRWERWVPGFAVKDIEVVNLDCSVMDNKGHDEYNDIGLL